LGTYQYLSIFSNRFDPAPLFSNLRKSGARYPFKLLIQGFGWAFPGGWLGVPRDGSLGTPSQPPGKTYPTPSIEILNGYLAPNFLRLKRKKFRICSET